NPAHDQVKLVYSAPESGRITVQLVDALGRSRSIQQVVRAGTNEVELDARGLAAGLYTVLVHQGEHVVHGKLALY
ncbi:MAG TPA: T9SS type A sorting domain-containing protein, partial [Hymenobacter sp.]|nr:T9SS type A sorting domain-containing protein [Hymenobacter sp.]